MTDDVYDLDGKTLEGLEPGWDPADLCVVVTTGGPFQTIDMPAAGALVVGRSSASDVLIDDPTVSRAHARLRWADGLQIQDMGSSNGVVVAGRRIDAGTWVPLRVGEPAQIGSALLVVRPKPSGRPRRLWTHGYFESRLEEECARCARTGAPFAVLRVSVPADVKVDAIEEAFAQWLRASDVLARYAPYEYEVLYVDSTSEQAAAATERLLEELVPRTGSAADRVRTGLASFPADARSADELLRLANDRGKRAPTEPGEPSGAPTLRLPNLAKVAASDVSVLLLGETGVGKEVCAERIHALSRRASGKLVRLNCAALSETLLESELFGHERGAFTGAARTKPGLLETAEGGTVLLDEVGEMPLATQVKLLRVLEERKVQRVGGLEPIPIDVRFIAATNRDLDAEVLAGRFRQDLLFRLNAFTFYIPPLRARTAEIEPLARHFIERTSRANGHPPPPLSAAAREMLLGYPWPGNIRELRNVIERAVVLAGSSTILPEHLPGEKMSATLLPAAVARSAVAAFDPASADWDGRPTMRFERSAAAGAPTPRRSHRVTAPLQHEVEELERARILEALEQCAGNQSKAAKLLGISRGALIKRLDRYGVARPRKPT